MATRAKKGTAQTFFDTFGEWSAEDQAAALKTLQIQHDQTRRMERRAKPAACPKCGVVGAHACAVVTTPVYPCGFCGAHYVGTHGDTCPNRPAPQQATIQEAIDVSKLDEK